MVAKSEAFVTRLTSRNRVLVLGGLAVIAHGYNRPTMDADIWLEPMESPKVWANALQEACSAFPGLSLHRLPGWIQIESEEVAAVARDIGLIRVCGLDRPVDVFRKPNELSEDEFDEVYARATPSMDGVRLPDPLDLIISKLNTGRMKDLDDSRFLETVIRDRYRTILPTASLPEVKELLSRFVDSDVCRMALENPDPEVRAHAISCLRELADEGDPFSQAILENREIP